MASTLEVPALRMAERLTAYLQAQMPAARNIAVFNIGRATQGSSRENWPFDATWDENGQEVTRKLILRRDPIGSALETPREPEFLVLKALEGTPVPAPKAYWCDPTGAWLERPFIIMERYEGICDFDVLNTTQYADRYPLKDRKLLARRYCEILAEIHKIDWRARELDVLGVPEGPFGAADAQIARWEAEMKRQLLEPQPILAEAMHWLKAHKRPAQHTTLVHGDFRPHNSLFRGGEVVVMLDWELAHIGDPMYDLGWFTKPAYRYIHFMPGVWEPEDFYRLYEELTGITVDHEAVYFWRVLSQFITAAIVIPTGIRSFCEGRTDRVSPGGPGMLPLVADLIGL